MYYIAQACGILVTVSSLIGSQFKYKWQMLINTTLANLLAALNVLLLGEVSSALVINGVAVVQSLLSLWHERRGRPVTRTEQVIFLVIYVLCGMLGYQKPLDLLPVMGAVFFMLATFQMDEQRTRLLSLANCGIFFIYYLLIGSTVLVAQAVGIGSILVALWRYRPTKEKRPS